MNINDWLRLLHPILAVTIVFPSIGIAVYFAWQTRQRRLKTAAKEKSKIPPTVGLDHVAVGRWLTAAVVGLTLIGLARPIFSHIIKNDVGAKEPFTVVFIVAMYVLTVATLALLYKAQTKVWRAVFATLSGAGIWILGSQDGVFRRTYEWQVSHYYYGMSVAMLMIFSLAILPDIYRSQVWRKVHIALNCIALLLFVVQGVTGTKDLLEIPLSWQEPFVYSCNFETLTCPGQP
jgi:Protein of unknown function (DUF4079)